MQKLLLVFSIQHPTQVSAEQKHNKSMKWNLKSNIDEVGYRIVSMEFPRSSTQSVKKIAKSGMQEMQKCHRSAKQTYLCLRISLKKSSLFTISNFSPFESSQGFLLQGQCNISISIIVIFLEDIRHTLQANAALHEEVETDRSIAPLIKSLEQGLHEWRTESVSECDQRIRVLVQADITTSVGIESVEQGSPSSEEAPETAEFLETDCA